ncbi:MAG: hypothetical protein RL038_681 [Actinomycetota bacterium]
MRKILVTGQIGSGKSTFAKALAGTTGTYVAADEIVRNLYRQQPEIIDEIETALAESFRNPAGEFDKAKLANRIFQDAIALRTVENIVHPLVEEKIAELLRAARGDLFVYENAVIRDSSKMTAFDEVIIVKASPEVRLQRLLGRGLSRADAEQRIATQLETEQLWPNGLEILNEGSITELLEQAQAIRDEQVRLNG